MVVLKVLLYATLSYARLRIDMSMPKETDQGGSGGRNRAHVHDTGWYYVVIDLVLRVCAHWQCAGRQNSLIY